MDKPAVRYFKGVGATQVFEAVREHGRWYLYHALEGALILEDQYAMLRNLPDSVSTYEKHIKMVECLQDGTPLPPPVPTPGPAPHPYDLKVPCPAPVPASARQEGGSHYTDMEIQPMEFSMANKLDAMQHTAIKYVSRFRSKAGIEDLRKAIHTIEMLIEWEEKHANTNK